MTQLLDPPASNGNALATQPVQAQRREIRVVHDDSAVANLMDTARFEHLQRLAIAMSASSLLPDHLRYEKGKNTNPPLERETISANCFRIINQALRWQMDPFAIIDETFLIGGKLGYSGKLVAGVVNARAGLAGRMHYAHDGQGDGRTVTVSGRFQGEQEDREVTLCLKDARTDNQMWRKDPDQKLVYSGIVKWARRYCPEVVLGIITDDDAERIRESEKERTTEETAPKPTRTESLKTKLLKKPAEPAPVTEETQVADDLPESTLAKDIEETQLQPDGSEAEAEGMPNPCPADWINDIVLQKKPAHIASGRAAKNEFHAADVSSWDKLPRERQQEKYDQLMDGTYPWKVKAPSS